MHILPSKPDEQTSMSLHGYLDSLIPASIGMLLQITTLIKNQKVASVDER